MNSLPLMLLLALLGLAPATSVAAVPVLQQEPELQQGIRKPDGTEQEKPHGTGQQKRAGEEQQKPDTQDRQLALRDLGDTELYFEAYYRRFFQFDAEGAAAAFEILAARGDSQYRRLALVRLLEIHRDAMRYQEMYEVLRRIRLDRGSDLPGVVRTEIRNWMREIQKHQKDVERSLREYLREHELRATDPELERARRMLSIQLISKGGRELRKLHFGSPFFSIALREYTGSASSGRGWSRHASELEELDRRIEELRAMGPAATEELGRLEVRRKAMRSKPPSPPHLQGSRAGAWHRAMVHRLQQKRRLREREGRTAIVRLYDERIHKHLAELVRIGLHEILEAPPERRTRQLEQIDRHLATLQTNLERDGQNELAATVTKLRQDLTTLAAKQDWKQLEQRILTTAENHPSLLQHLLLDH